MSHVIRRRFLAATLGVGLASGCGDGGGAGSNGDGFAVTGTGGVGAGGVGATGVGGSPQSAASGVGGDGSGIGGASTSSTTGTGGGPAVSGAGGTSQGGTGDGGVGAGGSAGTGAVGASAGGTGATGGGDGSGGSAGTGSAGTGNGGTGNGGTGNAGTGNAGTGGSGGYDYWPNPDAPANSDLWIRDHHDSIRVMRPRVLVLDVQRVGQPIATVTQRIIDAIAEGSRYHGYSNAGAPVFLEYEIEKIVDLRDPTAQYPSFWPPGPNFDVGELFTSAFAPRYGFENPDQPGSYLTMCQLFERGIVHELWIAAEAGVRAVYENQSRMQRYDANLNKISGSFQECTNGCFNDPQNRVNCSVSVRMQEVNKGRGPGCFTHAAGHALENMWDAIPYIRTNAHRFFYNGMQQRYGIPYNRLYDIDCFLGQAVGDRKCSFPSPTTLQYNATTGQSMTFTEFGQGCGDIHHKPNIYGSGVTSAQACEHYGLRDGANGRDQTTLYSQAGSLADTKMAEYESRFPDCDGGWQTYIRQSMPGYDNPAFAEDGTPMKNWWPFLFY